MVITSRKIKKLDGTDTGYTLPLTIPEKKTVIPIIDSDNRPVWYQDTQSMLFAHGLPMDITLDVPETVWGQGAESMIHHNVAINAIGQDYPIAYSDWPTITLENATIYGFRFYFSETKYMIIGSTSPRGNLNQFWFFEEGTPLWLFNFTYDVPSISSYEAFWSIPWYDLDDRDAYVYIMRYSDSQTGFRPDHFWMSPMVVSTDPTFPGVQPAQCNINTNPGYPSFDLDDVHRYFSEISTSSEWNNDSTEESEGQNGEYNDNSDIIGNDTIPDGCLNSSLINNFYLGNDDNKLGSTTIEEKLDIIGQWLCDFDFGSSFSNRLNSIVSLKLFFSSGDPDYEITDTTAGHLIIGGSAVDHSYPGESGGTKYVNACRAGQFTQKKIVEDFKVQKYFGNFLDYAPYTKVKIYLPFCGMQELDPSLVIDKNLTIWLKTDWVTGDIVYTIHSNGTLIYHFTGNSCFDIPISASDYGGKVTSLVSTAISAATMVGGVVGGNAPIAIGGAMGIAGNLATLGQKVETYTKGTLTNTFSMMDKLQPYLIITRPIQVKATSYASEKGYPSQLTANLGSVQGYCKIAEWKLQNIPNIPKEVVDRLDNLAKTEGLIL